MIEMKWILGQREITLGPAQGEKGTEMKRIFLDIIILTFKGATYIGAKVQIKCMCGLEVEGILSCTGFTDF